MKFQRADPEALARFNIDDKVCTMNCGPHREDPRSEKERRYLCPDCDVRRHRPKLRWNADRKRWVGADVAVEWRPKLRTWDAFRYCDSPVPRWNIKGVMVTTPTLRTTDFFEACCFVLGTRQFPGNHRAMSS